MAVELLKDIFRPFTLKNEKQANLVENRLLRVERNDDIDNGSEKKEQFTSHRRCLALCVFLNLGLIITGFLMIIVLGTIDKPSNDTCSRGNVICIPSEDGTTSIGCCKHDIPESLRNLLSILIAAKHTKYKKEDVSKIPNLSGKPKPRIAANLILDTSGRNNRTTDQKLQWRFERGYGTTFKMKDVRYANGSLIIPKSGEYLIYNELSIKSERQRMKEELVHSIFVENEDVRIRNDSRQAFRNRIERIPGDLTYQMSGVLSMLKLNKGDKLSTTLSKASAIYEESFTSVFGLYLMQD